MKKEATGERTGMVVKEDDGGQWRLSCRVL